MMVFWSMVLPLSTASYRVLASHMAMLMSTLPP